VDPVTSLRSFTASDDTTKHAGHLIEVMSPFDFLQKLRVVIQPVGLRNEKVGCSIHLSGTISCGVSGK
jgi:hypothetical protein